MVVIMVLMAVTSTGSSEVIAVTSIIVYDVYQLYRKVSLSILRRSLGLDSIRNGLPQCESYG